MERYDLPERWEWRRLGELADISAGTSAPQGEQYFSDGKYPFVRTQDVGKHGRTTCLKNTSDKVNDKAVSEKKLRKAKKGSIVLPKSGASILTNSRAILGVDAYITSHLAILEPNGSLLDSLYLYSWLCTIDMTSFSQSDNGYPSLRLSDIANIEIPVPPLPEQRRIIKRIEELTRRVEESRRLRTANLENISRLLPSAMEACFQGEGWERRTIRSLVLSKETWSQSKNPRKTFQYVDISAVDNKKGLIVNPKTISGDNPPSRAKRVMRSGDVIFATTRPYLRNIAIVPERLDNHICSTGFCVLRPKLEQVTTEWLFYTCRSDIVVDQVVPNQEKGAYPAVSDDEVYDSEIPVPSIAEQRRIVEYLDGLQAKAEELKHLQTETETELAAFTPSLLSKAFRGEL